ncbi:OmpA family protein [uncultured Croceitalea sp.]|uniref:OmpA family protein n=1 Tax=uncultured Croceitalea sp. TaxID=1798908 RepID=UPI0033062BB6
MKATRLTLLVITLLLFKTAFSQDFELTKQDSIVKSSWIFGIGFNVVDDAGSEFTDFFNVEDNWNIVPFPSRLSIGKYFENGLGLELIGSYNKYMAGKTVDNQVNQNDIDYYAADARISYDLNKILGETGFFDPYVGIGIGYTDANNTGRGTYNATVGFRTWFSDKFGLDFNSTGKWAMSTENASNHIQHAAGLVYRFGAEKGLSEKGKQKIEQQKLIEKELKRVQDSTLVAEKTAREAQELKERLEQEKAARLAESNNEKFITEKSNVERVGEEIKALGFVYFDLNSSYLSSRDKEMLGKLISILNKNSTVNLKITSHTDSRGSSTYNQWLSERRLKRTIDYLVSQGISADRLTSEAKGEGQLSNECRDGVQCSEAKHRENRRCEFMILGN